MSPTNRRLDIGTEGVIHYLIDNVIDWMVVTITKQTLDSDAPVFIGDFTILNGTSEGASYGDSVDHIRIDILSFDISVSFNLTVRFDAVQCSDGGTYLCSVTAPAYSHGRIELSEDIEAYREFSQAYQSLFIFLITYLQSHFYGSGNL